MMPAEIGRERSKSECEEIPQEPKGKNIVFHTICFAQLSN